MKVIALFYIAILTNLVYGQWNDTRKRINDEALPGKWHTITLRLNYFDAQDNRTFAARYITNDQFYKEGGPIVVYVGGEWAIADYGVMGGVAFQIARKYNGYLFYPEHRYYGESLPFPKPVSTENLKYITPDYSLADLAYSITYLKSQVKSLQNSQVILIGGSYAGALAIWARMKYPHVVSAVYNCGGVITTKPENNQYEQAFYDTYRKQNPECVEILKSGLVTAREMYAKSVEGKENLKLMFPDIDCDDGFFDIVSNLQSVFNPQVWPIEKVEKTCDYILRNTSGAPFERLKQTIERYFKLTRDCFSEYREWFYLVCTFLGNFQTSSTSNFGNYINFDKLVKQRCIKHFGPQFNTEFVKSHTGLTSILYGDNKPDVTKVLSIQGTHDPWRSNSILDDLNDETPVVYIEGANHCLELGEEQDDETAQVYQSKLEILDQLSKWIV